MYKCMNAFIDQRPCIPDRTPTQPFVHTNKYTCRSVISLFFDDKGAEADRADQADKKAKTACQFRKFATESWSEQEQEVRGASVAANNLPWRTTHLLTVGQSLPVKVHPAAVAQ